MSPEHLTVVERAASALVAATVGEPVDKSMDDWLQAVVPDHEFRWLPERRELWTELKDAACEIATPKIKAVQRGRDRICGGEGCDNPLRPNQAAFCCRKCAGTKARGRTEKMVTPEERATIIELYKSGLTPKQIVPRVGRQATTIYKQLRAAGVKLRRKKHRRSAVAPKVLELARTTDMTSLEIAAALDCSRRYVNRVIRDAREAGA